MDIGTRLVGGSIVTDVARLVSYNLGPTGPPCCQDKMLAGNVSANQIHPTVFMPKLRDVQYEHLHKTHHIKFTLQVLLLGFHVRS